MHYSCTMILYNSSISSINSRGSYIRITAVVVQQSVLVLAINIEASFHSIPLYGVLKMIVDCRWIFRCVTYVATTDDSLCPSTERLQPPKFRGHRHYSSRKPLYTAPKAMCLADALPFITFSCFSTFKQPVQLTFLGGRLAIRRALGGVTEAASAILHNQHGAPVLPDGVSASISHKRHMAVALVQSGCEGHVGACVLFIAFI